jgi:hypothetical protein
MTAHSTKEISSSRAIFASTLRIQKKDSAPSEHEHGTPGNRAPERFLLKMPQNLHSYDKQIFLSEGFGDQESLCQPIDEECEQVLISSMIDELNNKCGLELSHEYNLYRPSITSEPDREDVTEGELEKVVLVGGSHSTRLADELDETCLEVMDISVRGWRLSEASVEETDQASDRSGGRGRGAYGNGKGRGHSEPYRGPPRPLGPKGRPPVQRERAWQALLNLCCGSRPFFFD